MKNKELKPCPKCGSKRLTKGCSFKLSTPKIIRKIRQMHGVTCIWCGYSQPTIKRWNNAKSEVKKQWLK